MSIFEQDLARRTANYVPLSPVSFLTRAARIYPNRVAVIHGERRFTYAQFMQRARRLASSLSAAGVGVGDTVAIMAPNTPQMLEAHYAVPMLGAGAVRDQHQARCGGDRVHSAALGSQGRAD